MANKGLASSLELFSLFKLSLKNYEESLGSLMFFIYSFFPKFSFYPYILDSLVSFCLTEWLVHFLLSLLIFYFYISVFLFKIS